MKLLYVCSDFGIRPDGTKGASIHLRAITRAICDRGHPVTLLTPYGGPGGDHPAVPLVFDAPSRTDGGIEALRRWMKSRGLPHTVCGEMQSLGYNARVTRPALSALRENRPEAVVERLSLFGYVGADLAQTLRVPHIVEVNALLSREARRFRGLHMALLAEEIEYRVLHQADAVVVVSEQLGVSLGEIGIDADKIHVVPNGADIDRYDPDDDARSTRDALGLGDAFVIGFAGSLKSWHGVDLLLSAFERMRRDGEDAKLLIVGTGPMEATLREQVRSAGLERSVVFTGAVDHRDMPRHLGAMDVAVAPFRSMDGFYFSPIKLFEYMAAGRCVVASRLGQIEEVISDGSNGLLCHPDDVASLENAILTCRRDARLRRLFGTAGRRCVEDNYTWRRSAERTIRVISGAVAARAGGTPDDCNVSCGIPTETE